MKSLSLILMFIVLAVSPALGQDYTLNAFLKHDGDIKGVSFSEDGRTLASMGADRALHYWNPHTEKRQPHAEISAIDRWTIDPTVITEEPHTLPVNTFATSRQVVSFPGVEDVNGLLATGSSDKTIWLQGLPALQPLFRIQEQGEVWAVALSPDGQTLASSGDFAGIHLWDLRTISPNQGTIELKSTLTASTARVEGLAFSPDGQTLAAATGKSDGEAIHLWDLRTEQIRETLIAVGVPIRKVAFSSDGQMIAGGASNYSNGNGRNVLLWKRGPLSPARIPHSVELAGPETVTALNKDFTFTVTVKNAWGQPLENVVVTISNPENNDNWTHKNAGGVWTNSDGKAGFTLNFWDAGEHDMEVMVLDRATRTPTLTQPFIDRVEVPKPHSITLEDAAAKYVEELEDYIDTFIVKSKDDQALEGFQVRISTGDVSDTVFTDNKGKATCNLRMSLAGTYDVHVTVHDYWGRKVWLQNTFPNRISVGSQCDTTWTEPDSRVFSEHRRMTVGTNSFVSILEDGACDLFHNKATQQDMPTSSMRPCLRWTPTETVLNDLGTTVITVAFLNGTSADKKEVMDTIRAGWEKHANIHFVFHSDPSIPSDIRIKFRGPKEKKGNNALIGVTAPLEIAGQLYSEIYSAIGNNSALGKMGLLNGLVGWIPGTGWAAEEIDTVIATSGSLLGHLAATTAMSVYLGVIKVTGFLSEETMNFTHKEKLPDERQRTILHEFGHALGFHHLHNNPAYPFGWKNREEIYEHYTKKGWTRDRVDRNVFSVRRLPPTATFDPDSIMAYNIPSEWLEVPKGASNDLKTLASKGIKRKNVLSDGDKKAVSVVYGSPKAAYLVEGKLKIYGLDDDCPLFDSTNSETWDFQCVVAPQEKFSTVRLKDFYAGNEVRVEIVIGSRNVVNEMKATEAIEAIEMMATVRLFEGTVLTQYFSADEEDKKTEYFSIPINGSKLPDRKIKVENPKGLKILGCYVGGDYATVTLQEFRCTPFSSSKFILSAPSAASITATESRPIVPESTALLANYPNPFNPETWIPYQLAKPAEVTLKIYSVDGKLIRTLALGHQAAGTYHSKERAAYWDGRNAQGERVASGLYFYMLTAGNFSATGKMLVRK